MEVLEERWVLNGTTVWAPSVIGALSAVLHADPIPGTPAVPPRPAAGESILLIRGAAERAEVLTRIGEGESPRAIDLTAAAARVELIAYRADGLGILDMHERIELAHEIQALRNAGEAIFAAYREGAAAERPHPGAALLVVTGNESQHESNPGAPEPAPAPAPAALPPGGMATTVPPHQARPVANTAAEPPDFAAAPTLAAPAASADAPNLAVALADTAAPPPLWAGLIADVLPVDPAALEAGLNQFLEQVGAGAEGWIGAALPSGLGAWAGAVGIALAGGELIRRRLRPAVAPAVTPALAPRRPSGIRHRWTTHP
jgi:hypothetical protein